MSCIRRNLFFSLKKGLRTETNNCVQETAQVSFVTQINWKIYYKQIYRIFSFSAYFFQNINHIIYRRVFFIYIYFYTSLININSLLFMINLYRIYIFNFMRRFSLLISYNTQSDIKIVCLSLEFSLKLLSFLRILYKTSSRYSTNYIYLVSLSRRVSSSETFLLRFERFIAI